MCSFSHRRVFIINQFCIFKLSLFSNGCENMVAEKQTKKETGKTLFKKFTTKKESTTKASQLFPAEAKKTIVGIGASAGGMAVVQEEKQTRYNNIPRSAIDTGHDYVLPVEKMVEELMKYVKHPYIESAAKIKSEKKQKISLKKGKAADRTYN